MLAGFLIHRIGLAAVLAVELVSYTLALLTLAGVRMAAIEGASEREPSTNERLSAAAVGADVNSVTESQVTAHTHAQTAPGPGTGFATR